MPKDDSSRKIINRSLLVSASNVLAQLITEDNDSTMGDMRQRCFDILPREDITKVREYFNSPSDYTINEDVDQNKQGKDC
jgi:hypothetical protein